MTEEPESIEEMLLRLEFMRGVVMRLPQSLDKQELLRNIGWLQKDLHDHSSSAIIARN